MQVCPDQCALSAASTFHDMQGLDLYGRADHLQREPEPPTASERLQMGLRAMYLLLVFTPFILLGPLLLYLSSLGHSKAAGEAAAGARDIISTQGRFELVLQMRLMLQIPSCAGRVSCWSIPGLYPSKVVLTPLEASCLQAAML